MRCSKGIFMDQKLRHPADRTTIPNAMVLNMQNLLVQCMFARP